MDENLKVLVVDDDEVDRMAICRALKINGISPQIVEAEDYKTAMAKVQQHTFDCAFIDYLLPDSDGLALVRELRTKGLRIPLIVLTGQGDEQIAVELMKAGATDYMSKSRISSGRLIQTVQNALRLYQAETEAAIAIEQKEELARQREDFVSRMTHDLRTPLIAANRMLQLFQEEVYGEISPQMNRAIGVMMRSNQNLIEMVNNLLEVYCHEAGYKQLNFTNLDLRDIIHEVEQELLALAEEKGIALKTTIGTEGNFRVMGDRLELRRVLINLVGNAIKFTDEGYINIGLKPASADDQCVTLTVKDTGSGINSEDLKTLFERFRQGNHKRSTSGLGLYLSRRIVEAHIGEITVESEIGKGSVFRVSLPHSSLSATSPISPSQ